MRTAIIQCIVLIAGLSASADVSASNKLELWIEDTLAAASYRDRFDVQYSDDRWLIGARFELDEDVRQDFELGERIRRRFAEYRADAWMLRGGTYYATFGHGILLRAEEDEIVNLDRDLDGAYGSVNWRRLEGQGFLGRPRNDLTRERDDLLSGAEAGYWLTNSVRLGGGYVRLDAVGDSVGLDVGRPIEELVGGNGRFMAGPFDAQVEYARRYVWGERDPRGGWMGVRGRDGHAAYGALTLGFPGYTFVVEGKDYWRFNFPYSTPPTANRDQRPVNGGLDERGFGFSATASPRDDWTVDGGFSWAEAREAEDSRTALDLAVRKDWWSRGALEVGGVYVSEEGLQGHDARKYAGPSFSVLKYLSRETTVSIEGEVLSREDSLLAVNQEYTEYSATVSATRAPWGSLNVTIITSSEELQEYDDEDTWVAAELAWRITQEHELRVRAGDERGGIVCSGGVCRYEPPFSGVKATLTSRF